MVNQLSPPTLQSRSYTKLSERLRQFMLERQLQSGDKLPPERSLAETFGVSRSSIREAIRVLAEKGLLESRQGDGTYVRIPDIEPLTSAIVQAVDAEGSLFDQVIEYRELLEPHIAALAALRHTAEQLNQLKIITCDQQRCLLIGDNDGELDARFHLLLAECTGNALFMESTRRLNELYVACRDAELRDAAWRTFSVESHLRVIDALERRSPEDARRALAEHLHTVRQKHIFSTSRDTE